MNRMLFTAIIIVSLVLPSAALGYSGGSGEPNDPYQIATEPDLLALAATPEDYNKCFILTADINMAGQVFTTALIAPDTNSTSWGFQGTVFSGVFDGNSHKITHLNIDGGSNHYLGLFGCVNTSGSVKNLGIQDCNISAADTSLYVSGLMGNNNGSITNCYSTGTVSAFYDAGGLVGQNEGSITNSYSTGPVSGNAEIGGLVGFNDTSSSITNCYSTSTVNGAYDSAYIGGLVGVSTGNITNCCSKGTVSGSSNSKRVGGLVGYNVNGSITNSYSTGNVNVASDSSYVGGLVGYNYSSISKCYSTGNVSGSSCVGGLAGYNSHVITNCYSTGTTAGTSHVGGLVGRAWTGSINNCYSKGDVSGTSDTGGLVGSKPGGSLVSSYFLSGAGPDNGYGTPLTDEQMKQQDNFIDWDFVEIWNIAEFQTCPFLRIYLPSDIDMDGETNFYDLTILASHWLQQK